MTTPITAASNSSQPNDAIQPAESAILLGRPSRRQLLRLGVVTAVGFGAGVHASSSSADEPSKSSANDRMRVAFVGCGGRGGSNLNAIGGSEHCDVVALCDVSEKALNLAGRQHGRATQFRDFRKMYDAMSSQIDAVVVSTAEHTHAFATMPALQLGKHVYCEKPLAYNIDETRQITAAAAAAGVTTQMGTQMHATANYRSVVGLIQSGAIGAVNEVHTWVGRAWGLQSKAAAERNNDRVFVTDRPAQSMSPPADFDWDLWLGPAPQRPYHDVYFPSPAWYRWWDFANGTMSDLGSHWNDLSYWALQLDAPISVQAFGDSPHAEIAPASMKAIYEYGPRHDLPAVTASWYQGDMKPERWINGEIPQWSSGVLFVGTGGMLLADYKRHLLLPEQRFVDFEPTGPPVPTSPGHHAEWILACRGEGQTGSPFSYAGPLTEGNHLGNVAFRTGQKIFWDADQMKCIDCPEAEAFIRRTPRAGWSLS